MGKLSDIQHWRIMVEKWIKYVETPSKSEGWISFDKLSIAFFPSESIEECFRYFIFHVTEIEDIIFDRVYVFFEVLNILNAVNRKAEPYLYGLVKYMEQMIMFPKINQDIKN